MGAVENKLRSLGFDVEQYEENGDDGRIYYLPGIKPEYQSTYYDRAKAALEAMATRCGNDISIVRLHNPARMSVTIYKESM